MTKEASINELQDKHMALLKEYEKTTTSMCSEIEKSEPMLYLHIVENTYKKLSALDKRIAAVSTALMALRKID